MKYIDFNNVFLNKSVKLLLKRNKINEHATKVKYDKQSLPNPIQNLKPIEFETSKTYIIINLANSFIWPLKSPAITFIFFI